MPRSFSYNFAKLHTQNWFRNTYFTINIISINLINNPWFEQVLWVIIAPWRFKHFLNNFSLKFSKALVNKDNGIIYLFHDNEIIIYLESLRAEKQFLRSLNFSSIKWIFREVKMFSYHFLILMERKMGSQSFYALILFGSNFWNKIKIKKKLN